MFTEGAKDWTRVKRSSKNLWVVMNQKLNMNLSNDAVELTVKKKLENSY